MYLDMYVQRHTHTNMPTHIYMFLVYVRLNPLVSVR